MLTPSIIHELEVFSNNNDILVIYLFGSQVDKLQLTNLSDIDIAILLPDSNIQAINSPMHKGLLISELQSIFKTDSIDLLILNSAPLSLKYSVVKYGTILYVKKLQLRLDFEEEVFKFFMDFRYFIDNFNKLYLESIQKNGVL